MRTVIDIDKNVLELAQRELGTATMRETVHRALEGVVARVKAREAFEFYRNLDNPDLLDLEIDRQMWA
jgi:Arc/MetJ family transcription regulator